MEPEYYLSEQIKKHPSMQPQDVVKLCYQAAFGAEHLLSDTAAARRYLYAELDSVEAVDGELCEPLTDGICRVNLAVWKARGLPCETLFEIFAESARLECVGEAAFCEYLDVAEQMAADGKLGFTLESWQAFLSQYKAFGGGAVHHSQVYRQAEKPSYRIVKRELIENILKQKTLP
jgi:hypothetical protein